MNVSHRLLLLASAAGLAISAASAPALAQKGAAAIIKTFDPDNDGTLDAKELGSKAGKALVKLIK